MITQTLLVLAAFLAVVEGHVANSSDRTTRVPDKVDLLPDGRVKCFKANQVARRVRRALKDGETPNPDGTRPTKVPIRADFDKEIAAITELKEKYAMQKAEFEAKAEATKMALQDRIAAWEAEKAKREEATEKARETVAAGCSAEIPDGPNKERITEFCKTICGRELPEDAPENFKERYNTYCGNDNDKKRSDDPCLECRKACPQFTTACAACIRQRNANAESTKDGETVLQQLSTLREVCAEQEEEETSSRETRCSVEAARDLTEEERTALRAECTKERDALVTENEARVRVEQAAAVEKVRTALASRVADHEAKLAEMKARVEASVEKLRALMNDAEAKKEREDALKCTDESTDEEKEACKEAREEYIARKKAQLGDDLTDKAKCFRRHRRRLRVKLAKAVACADSEEEATEAVFALLAARFKAFCENNSEAKLCTGANRERLQEFAAKIAKRVEGFLDENETDENLKCRQDVDVVVDVADPASNDLVLDNAERKRMTEDLIDLMTDALSQDDSVLSMEIADEPVDEALEEVIFLDEATAEVDGVVAGTDAPNPTGPTNKPDDKATSGQDNVDDGSSASNLAVSALMGVAVFVALL